MRRHGRAVTRSGLEAFRSQAWRKALIKSPHRQRRVYLSRKDAMMRRVLNEPAVEALLQAHGFETVQTERLSVFEQVALFSNAEIIAGPHGAGLTNAVFADAPHIIEFLPADLWDLGYYVGLAISCGGTYNGIVCDGGAIGDDMTVNLSILETTLNELELFTPNTPSSPVSNF
jgi:capsular polysaccharide biosynthesis protein